MTAQRPKDISGFFGDLDILNSTVQRFQRYATALESENAALKAERDSTKQGDASET